jgi:pyridoxine 5-phosphate synthase
VVEIHTGAFCDKWRMDRGAASAELRRIVRAAEYGGSLGLEIHAGHGISYDTVQPVTRVPQVKELNIGHFLVGEAIFVGLTESIAEMRRRMDLALTESSGAPA